ncbi:MAG: hypothetical protein OK456_00735 [Thaumarchaeota archaeon]|nr:hypothetical protein [Nitrososphaerota archaeon]
MSSDKKDSNGSPEGDGVHSRGTKTRHFRGYWNLENTKDWVEMFLEDHLPIEDIADKVVTDPATVSAWIKKHGVEVHQGMRRKERDPPQISQELAALLAKGPDEVLKYLDQRVWGISASEAGLKQLKKFCDFLALPLSVWSKEVVRGLHIDKSMVGAWTKGTMRPYLVRVADTALHTEVRPGWKLLPLWLESGGNEQGSWIQVPTQISSYDDIQTVVRQLTPLQSTYQRGAIFGLVNEQIDILREDLFSYLLGIMGGDASKAGGKQKRFTSSNVDLHLTLKQPTNERLGEFACLCTNSLGIIMDRKQDKQPTGTTRFGMHPSAAYRWISARSPVIAWMFNVGLGLKWDECTTLHQLKMDWIFSTPKSFRTRFIQGMADSDGSMKPYEVVITSVPNADFMTRLLQSLGMSTAHTIYEENKPLRTMVNAKQATALPIFNEFVKSYRYQRLMEHI